jgi:hypothetical protein
MSGNDVIMVGGPRDGEVVTAREALIEVEIDGMLHRYVQTHASRESGGRTYPVYNYDGMVNPRGAESGVEDAEDRLRSPAAREDT